MNRSNYNRSTKDHNDNYSTMLRTLHAPINQGWPQLQPNSSSEPTTTTAITTRRRQTACWKERKQIPQRKRMPQTLWHCRTRCHTFCFSDVAPWRGPKGCHQMRVCLWILCQCNSRCWVSPRVVVVGPRKGATMKLLVLSN
jgi:hypothetical protein